jgi:hypothetical protein
VPLTLRSFCRLLRVIVTRMPIRLASWTSLSKASNMPTLGFASELNLNSPPPSATPRLHCFPATFAKGSRTWRLRPERAELQSSSCRRFKESRSDRPTNLETRHRKRELDPAKADGTDHQLRVVTWPGVEVVVSWTFSGTCCSL